MEAAKKEDDTRESGKARLHFWSVSQVKKDRKREKEKL